MNHICLITTFNRLNLLNQCIESLKETTPDSKIFVVNDGSDEDTKDYLLDADVECVISNKTNIGISPSIEIGLKAIDTWTTYQKAEGKIKGDVFVSYVQDDVVFVKHGWPKYCIGKVKDAELKHGATIGFLTGHVAPEHEGSKEPCPLPGCLYRRHIRATHMMAPLSYWLRHLPIDPIGEAGIVRGHPGEGRGSDVDWWFIRGHEDSVEKSGRVNLVVPDILKHIGADRSTWQPNATPEIN